LARRRAITGTSQKASLVTILRHTKKVSPVGTTKVVPRLKRPLASLCGVKGYRVTTFLRRPRKVALARERTPSRSVETGALLTAVVRGVSLAFFSRDEFSNAFKRDQRY
jgi:hypothetical protein